MKKRIVTLMLSLVLILGMIPINSIADRTVYITKTGSKYHSTKECSGLNRAKNIYSCSESEAKSEGLTKCSICWDSSSNDETPVNVPTTKPVTNTVKVGSTKTVGKNKYVVTSASTVRYKSPVSKKITSIKIPKSVKIKGKTYQVTAIANKAFSGCKKLKKVIINSPIKKIGKYAFYNCSKLKTIKIYSKKLTKNNVLTEAFKGIAKKAIFYLPKNKIASYKKFLLKRGGTETMKYRTN